MLAHCCALSTIFFLQFFYTYQQLTLTLLHEHVFSQKHLLWKVEVEAFSSHIIQLGKIIKWTLFLTIKVVLMIYLLHLSIRSPERKRADHSSLKFILHKNFVHHFFHLYELLCPKPLHNNHNMIWFLMITPALRQEGHYVPLLTIIIMLRNFAYLRNSSFLFLFVFQNWWWWSGHDDDDD